MTKRDQLGNFELMVMLVLIRLGDNAYGVPISEELEKRTGRDVAIGSVYAALERLEDKGFVTSELGEPTAERGGRAKKYFHVTARGLEGSARDAAGAGEAVAGVAGAARREGMNRNQPPTIAKWLLRHLSTSRNIKSHQWRSR